MEDASPLPYQHTESPTVFTVSLVILPTLAVLPSVLLLNTSLTGLTNPGVHTLNSETCINLGGISFFFLFC